MANVEAKINGRLDVNGGQNEGVNGIDQRKQLGDSIMNCKTFSEETTRDIMIENVRQKESNKLNIQQSSQLSSTHSFKRGDVIPIDDISDVASSSYGNAEKILRCKLASLYRLVDLRGWSQGIFNSITVRLDVQGGDEQHFLTNPYGLMFQEITASSLVKVNLEGDILDPGTSHLHGINPTGYLLHSTIHAARPNIRCIIHMHTPSCVAVSASAHGLLPLSQEAFIVGDVSYHDFDGTLDDEQEGKSLIKDLGPTNNVMFLRNHSIVCCGETVEEAFYRLYYAVLACKAQVTAMVAGIDNLILIPESVYRKSRAQLASFDLQRKKQSENRNCIAETRQLLFEAYMRAMDTTGYRTGYDYLNPFARIELVSVLL